MIKKEIRVIRTGPFLLFKNSVIYRVTVKKPGEVKGYWLRVGGFWWPDPDNISAVSDIERNMSTADIFVDHLICAYNIFLFTLLFLGIMVFVLVFVIGIDMRSFIETWMQG